MIYTAVAMGAIFSVGGGTFKAAIKTAFKSGKGAGYERLALEFGGKKAANAIGPEMMAKMKLSSVAIRLDHAQKHSDRAIAEKIILRSSEKADSKITAIFGHEYKAISAGATGPANTIDDLALLVRKGKNIDTNTVKRIFKNNKFGDKIKMEGGKPVSAGKITDEEYEALTRELTDLQTTYKGGTFFDGLSSLQNRLLLDLANSGPNKEAYMKIVSDEGVLTRMESMRMAGVFKKESMDEWNRMVDDIAPGFEKHIKETIDSLPGKPGDILKPNTPRGAFFKQYEDVLKQVEGDATTNKAAMATLTSRVETYTKGLTVGQGGWTLDRRKKLMFAAVVGAYIATKVDADAEKYLTCGGNNVCQHFPRLFGDDNNEGYKLIEEAEKEYGGLVRIAVPTLTGEKMERLHIVSPCKTDLVV